MLDAVEAESLRLGARVVAVGVKIGELSGVDPESLRFCFEVLTRNTEWATMALEIEPLPWRNRCRQCGETFTVVEYRTECPRCGSDGTEMAGGNELEFAYMEIEEQ